jgi:rod shape-determining protein MreD
MLSEPDRARASGTPVILITFLAAAFLEVVPLPEVLDALRPEWMALTLIYWVIALPHRIGVFWGFFAGLFQDALTGVLLGQHALAYVLVAYITLLAYKRLRVFSALQQSGVVFLLTGTAVLTTFTVQSIAREAVQAPLEALLPALVSAVLWRVVFVVLRQVRRQFWVR